MTITLDESKINNPGRTEYINSPFVTALSITISGATAGDGTFGLSDYTSNTDAFALGTDGGTLDFSRELISQPTGEDPFGTTNDGHSGTFNIFNIFTGATGQAVGAPNSISFFEISTYYDGAVDGQDLQLTSFAPEASHAPEVPESGILGLLGVSLGGLLLHIRRRPLP